MTKGVTLSNHDKNLCREIHWQQRNRISIAAYEQRRAIEPGRESFYVAAKRINELGCLAAKTFDCCISSCVAFTGPYSQLIACPVCGLARFGGNSRRARKTFDVIAIEDRLRACIYSPDVSKLFNRRKGNDAQADFCGGDGFKRSSLEDNDDTMTIYVSASLDGYLLFKQ